MKKLLILVMLFFTSITFTQDYNDVSNPIVDVAVFKAYEVNGLENALTVPDGYFVTIADKDGTWYWRFPDGTPASDGTIDIERTTLPAGFKFYSENNNEDHIIVYVHEYSSSGSTFSYTEAELDNSVKLFPNPTTSEVALNSEKTYEIEVFDVLGNKVMELVGNSINMEHLSNATYIVNALDVETQESLSYKVIKK